MSDYIYYNPDTKDIRTMTQENYDKNRDKIKSMGIVPEENTPGISETSSKPYQREQMAINLLEKEEEKQYPMRNAMPYAVEGKYTRPHYFKSLNMAKQYKDQHPDAEIKIGVITPSRKEGVFAPSYIPEAEYIQSQKEDYPKYALKKYGDSPYFAANEEEYYTKESNRLTEKGGLGAARRGRIAGQSALSGIIPFSDLLPSISQDYEDIKNDDEKMFSAYNENPKNNKWANIALNKIVPAVTGGMATGFGASKIPGNAGTVARFGINPTETLLNKAGQGIQKYAPSALRNVAENITKNASKIPFASTMAPAVPALAKIAKGFAEGAGDGAINYGASVLGDVQPYDQEALLMNMGLGGGFGVAGQAIPALASAVYTGAKNKIAALPSHVEKVREQLNKNVVPPDQKSPDLQRFDDTIDSITEASKITLRGEQPNAVSNLPSMVKTRLGNYENRISDLSKGIDDVAANKFPELFGTGYKETIPDYLQGVTQKQEMDMYGVKGDPISSSYPDTTSMVNDLGKTLTDEYSALPGFTPEDAKVAKNSVMFGDINNSFKTLKDPPPSAGALPVGGKIVGGTKGILPIAPAAAPVTYKNDPLSQRIAYEKVNKIVKEGTASLYADKAAPTAHEQKVNDTARQATRYIMANAFKNKYTTPQTVKDFVLTVRNAAARTAGTPDNQDIKTFVTSPDFAKNLANAARFSADMDFTSPSLVKTMDYRQPVTREPGFDANGLSTIDNVSPSVDDTRSPQAFIELDKAQVNLRNAMPLIHAATNDPVSSANLEKFNTELGTLIEQIKAVAKEWSEIKTDEAFLKLKNLVDNDWKIVEDSLTKVITNDLGATGRLFREGVLLSNFIGNIPVVGVVGKVFGALKMAQYALTAGSEGNFTVPYNPLDAIVLSKNIDRVQEALVKKFEDFEKSTKLNLGLAALRGGRRATFEEVKGDSTYQKDAEMFAQIAEKERAEKRQQEQNTPIEEQPVHTAAPQEELKQTLQKALQDGTFDQVLEDIQASKKYSEDDILSAMEGL